MVSNLKEDLTLVTSSSNMQQGLEAFLKFGTVFLVYRVLNHYINEDPDVELFDSNTLIMAILILVGFVLYYLLIVPLLPTEYASPVMGKIVNDILMWGTALIFSSVVGSYITGSEMFSSQWMKTTMFILLGLVIYRVLLEPLMPVSIVAAQSGSQAMLSDWALYGSVYIITMLLNGSGVNTQLVLGTLFVLIGFAAYYLVVDKVLNIRSEVSASSIFPMLQNSPMTQSSHSY